MEVMEETAVMAVAEEVKACVLTAHHSIFSFQPSLKLLGLIQKLDLTLIR